MPFLRLAATTVVATALLAVPLPAFANPHWQLPLWFQWFSPQPAQVDPLEGNRGGITGPGMSTSVVEGSLSAPSTASRVSFAAPQAGGSSGGGGLPAFRKPTHVPRPNIPRADVKLAWGNERHPRPIPPRGNTGGQTIIRTAQPSERPLLTLPSGREAWNARRPDGQGTIDIREGKPGSQKRIWSSWERP